MKFLFLLYLLFFFPSVGDSQELLELNKKFIELFQQGKYEEAIPYAEKAFAMAKKELSDLQKEGKIKDIAGKEISCLIKIVVIKYKKFPAILYSTNTKAAQ